MINFNFTNPFLEDSYCKYYGRPAKEPEIHVNAYIPVSESVYKIDDSKY